MSDNPTLPASGVPIEGKDIGSGVIRQFVGIRPVDGSAADSIGGLTETAPASDTASSGLNGRLQRIAQRITSLIALFPTALTGSGNFKVALVESTANQAAVAAQPTATTGTFTNATQTTNVAATGLSGYDTVTVSINGTYGTATGVFEVSDDGGTTWYSVQGARSDTNVVEAGYTSLTNTSRMWIIPLHGVDRFRVRSTAVASGTVNARITPTGFPTADSAVVQLAGSLPAGSNLIGSATAVGDVASGSTDSGNPQKIGGLAKTANPTAVSDGQRVAALFDKLGKQVVVGAIRDLKDRQSTTISNTTAETTIVTAIASTFIDLYGLMLANTGASTTKVTIRDATGAGSPFVIEVPSLETRGFMLSVDSAIKQGAVNNNWTAQCATATTALEVTALYVKNT